MADNSALPRSAAGSFNPWILAGVVSIATFMEVLDTTIANVALRHIAGSLSASQDESTYILTSYLVSNAIVLPISGYLSKVIGRKRFYMGCVALFTVSSVLCATASSLWEMLLWRVLQGMGGGGLAPVEQSMFADSFTPEKRAQAFALYGVTVVTAPALGPVLGGWLTDTYSWHWVFLINLPFGLLSLTLTYFVVSDSKVVQDERKELLRKGVNIDWLGFLLVIVGFGALQICFDRFEREDGFDSPLIITCACLAAFSLITLVLWDAFHPQPAVDVRLFRVRSFSICCVVMFMFGFTLYSTTQLLPQLAQELLHYDATTAGLTLGAAGIASLVVMPIAGIVTGKIVQPKWLILAALLGIAYSMSSASGLNLEIAFGDISIARMLQVAWLPLIFIPLSAVSYIGVPPAKNPEASSLINLMRNIGGSAGISYSTTLLAYREQFHHARLAEHVTPYNSQSATSTIAALQQVVERQADILSYLDIFHALAITALIAAPLALFLPRIPKGAPSGEA